MKTVAVVGSGVIGACVAFCLAQRGVNVHSARAHTTGGPTTNVGIARLSAYQQRTYTRCELSHRVA
ncbi:3-hydroxyacyl-CoA dehydrogenase NAD-binding domain-containing protein [Saccharopolyspora hattusasensis]|uniref:3-hydroxyacyl-CoA dehydrogenase NAD-binding domain-containing protein n=1 Tax=Saccharopolyspora hattusasensis TaxID=1128679 RepID=UPI003D96EA27